ncbi:MAG: hypothetical protein NVS2B12_19680 [Ktedonobacteraceae bacterium]
MDVQHERVEYDTERVRRFEAIFEAITDPLFIVDAQRNVRNMNQAARDLLGIDSTGWLADELSERGHCFELYDLQGHLLPDDQWPQMPILRGAVLRGEAAIDVMMRLRDGSTRFLSVTGAPVYTDTGEVSAAALVCRDVTERRRVEETLLTMAEVLANVPAAIFNPDVHVAHQEIERLAELTCELLGCEVATIFTIEPETLQLHALVGVGAAPVSEQTLPITLGDYLSQYEIAQFMAGEALLIDLEHTNNPVVPPYHGMRQMLSAPLRIGEQLLGLLSTSYDTATHKYPLAEEKILLRAIGKLIALMLERERLIRERAEALARELALREINRKTDEFISIISHELKSPLTTIKGNIQLARRQTNKLLAQETALAEEVINPLGQVQHFLERAEHHILMQTRLINDLLDVSRIHADRLELHSERRDLVPIVREAVEDQRHLSFSRDIRLAIEASEAFIMADADRVGQVLNNYLSNALKYSDKSKPVEVRLYCTDTRARVEVIDEGPGLSVQQQERIWESFYRVPEVEVKSGSGVGLGLGLHICRTIIERQGGHVGVESTLGQGSIFWFDLPLTE